MLHGRYKKVFYLMKQEEFIDERGASITEKSSGDWSLQSMIKVACTFTKLGSTRHRNNKGKVTALNHLKQDGNTFSNDIKAI